MYIGENKQCAKFQNIQMNLITLENIFADLEKAFDSLNYAFMLKCLRHFYFGNDPINGLNYMYSIPTQIIQF